MGAKAKTKASAQAKIQEVFSLDLPENPTLAVEVEGKILHLELGNMTYALQIKELIETINVSMAQARELTDGLDALDEIAQSGAKIIEAAFQESEAVDILLGGRQKLNISRLLVVLRFILEKTTSQESINVVSRAAEAFAATADED